MSVRTLLVTLLALVCGGSAAIGINMFLNARAAKAETETVPVLVALNDIERATKISADHIRRQDWPKDLVPPGAVSNPEEVIGRSTLERLVQNEPILAKKLADKDAGEGLGVLVRDGMWAKTILTPTAATSVGSFLRPGNRVDVSFTLVNTERYTGGVVSGVILQDIEVLAVDRAYQRQRDTRNETPQATASVTLHVTPEQGLILDAAMTRGTLSLALRRDNDRTASSARVLTLRDLLDIPVEKVPEVKQPPPAAETKKEVVKQPEDAGPTNHKMDIIEGGKVTSHNFDLKKPKKNEKKGIEGTKPEENPKPDGNDKTSEAPRETESKTP